MATDWNLALTSNLLRRGKALDGLSTGITLIALAWGLIWQLAPFSALLCALLLACGLLQKYWAIRVALDADLFQQMANTSDLPADTQRLDQALTATGLMSAEKAGRSWHARGQGALRLLKYQAAALTIQFLLGIVAVLIAPWFSFA